MFDFCVINLCYPWYLTVVCHTVSVEVYINCNFLAFFTFSLFLSLMRVVLAHQEDTKPNPTNGHF